jgi:O-acetyl-ADP-ribose deacetylase (regulator of RNase III)
VNKSDLEYVKGDAVKALQEGKVDFLMHCCNAQGVMGAGIALQVREAFPESYAYYKHWCETSGKGQWLLGRNVVHSNVINAIGQHKTGRGKQVHYGAIAKCIAELGEDDRIRNVGIGMRPTKIAVPYLMGCGLAGGDWTVVEELLQAKPSFVSIYVYHLGDL